MQPSNHPAQAKQYLCNILPKIKTGKRLETTDISSKRLMLYYFNCFSD